MFLPSLVAGGFGLLMVSATELAAAPSATAPSPVAVAAQTAPAAGPFPTQEMADQFDAYLSWTKENGLSRLAVFESPDPSRMHHTANLSDAFVLPTPEMSEQFAEYLRWTREQGLSEFYAFKVTEYD